MTMMNIIVKMTSANRPAASEYPPGECAAYPLAAKPLARLNAGPPLATT
jgi:hypothetical protein